MKGRATEGGKPSANALSASGLSRGGKVEKSDFLTPDRVSEADVEAAYEVYKAAALENEFKGSLEEQFATRFQNERVAEVTKAEAAAFDARGPLAEIQKSIAALTERIENGPAQVGEDLQKSEDSLPAVEVPSTEALADMSWDEVHSLANRAFGSEN